MIIKYPEESSDYFLIKYLNKLAPKICWIKPNYITFFSALLTIPVIYNILNKGSTLEFILLILLRHVSDCLDGIVARKCKTESRTGAYLDLIFDFIFILAVFYSYYYVINNDDYLKNIIIKSPFKTMLILLMFLSLIISIYFFVNAIFSLYKNKKKNKNKFFKWVEENEIIFLIINCLIIKYTTLKQLF